MLASGVVFAADAGHHVQEVNVAAAVGVAIALTVWTSQVGETPGSMSIWGKLRQTEDIPKNIQGKWEEASLEEGLGRGSWSGCNKASSASFESPGGPWAGSQGGQGRAC